ncbi:MAG: cyclodeaminase/cyclohydrolase family protein [Rubrobacter sp.]|nr:cyclodeaminase/cyclohydrolase family protein [Rubrobacter sp.]
MKPAARETTETPDYLEQPLGRFLDAVASGEPAPGGGAAAAVTVALAAGLCSMAARFSYGKLSGARELADRTESLRREAAALAGEDAAAYGRVLEAYRMPRAEDPEHRRQRIRAALLGAADVPLAVAGTGASVAEAAVRLAESGNPNLAGDAVTAALLAEAGTRAAAELVDLDTENPGGEPDGMRRGRARRLSREASESARRATGSPG